YKEAREGGKVREGDAKCRSAQRNVEIGQDENPGRGLKSFTASFVALQSSTCKTKSARSGRGFEQKRSLCRCWIYGGNPPLLHRNVVDGCDKRKAKMELQYQL